MTRYIVAAERIVDPETERVIAGPGDTISLADAERLGVGPDGRLRPPPPADEPMPLHSTKRPRARTRAGGGQIR